MNQVTSQDQDYQIGDLSKFPVEIDTEESFLKAANKAETELAAPLDFKSSIARLKDGSGFESSGVIRVNDELIFYEMREGNMLFNLHRGFANSGRFLHRSGSKVFSPVVADMHNSIRDAIVKIQSKVGIPGDLEDIADEASLWSKAAYLNRKWFTPKALFFSHNRVGKAPLGVQFRDFSLGGPIRWIWEFGDGGLSSEQHPFHVYSDPGEYDVSLTIFSEFGSGVAIRRKIGYVSVLDPSFVTEVLFYAEIFNGSIFLPSLNGPAPLVVRFTDQTSGNIQSRIWTFGDGETETISNPETYQVTHTYNTPGIYQPALVVTDGVSTVKRNLDQDIRVGVV